MIESEKGFEVSIISASGTESVGGLAGLVDGDGAEAPHVHLAAAPVDR